MIRSLAFGVSALLASTALVQAQERGVTYSLHGAPGLIEMPGAMPSPDATLGTTVSYAGGEYRLNLGFQVTDWLFASYTLGIVPEFDGDARYNARAFNLRWNIRGEEGLWPAIALGVNDITGGYNSGEYLVATKTLSDSVRVTAGLGWGRLAGDGSFDNLLGLDDRDAFDPSFSTDTSLSHLFHGPMAVFGGLEWAFHDDFTLKVEYSTDDGYRDALGDPLFDRESPVNLGLTWRPNNTFNLSAAYLYGNTFGLSGTFYLYPGRNGATQGTGNPPQPITPRSSAPANAPADLNTRLTAALAAEGVTLHAIEMTATSARIQYQNTRYRAEAQAVGRVLRVLSAQMPAQIDSFVLEPVSNGIPLSRATFRRADLERWENRVGGTDAIAAAMDLRDAAGTGQITALPQPRFEWGFGPTLGQFSRGDGRDAELALGVQVNASYAIMPNLIVDGVLSQRLLSNIEDDLPIPNPDYETVRRDGGQYGADGPGISRLALAWYERPATDIYTRVTFGLLEAAYGGASAEVLYKPVDSRWAVGVELDYVVKRDYDMLFDFQDYETVSVFVSGYYDFDNGFLARADVGRYLAGDWGATIGLDREFANGWRVGGFVTMTDMPFSDYGSGSFTKGIRLTVPLDGFIGRATRSERNVALNGPLRDGGARVRGTGDLYDLVRTGHQSALDEGWGQFWQ
ncbi:YjbH domain-containing protein [Ketogulonicigenium vulgare]|uniref:Putative lipoprotein n=1 Tax=Ketogulonicigenium vulgare (strain WSH-001) TaxID=759362 RepID=F9Y6M2_KETVW|nr:YjbH domain-containing protein [Ketogulonicigenium vulgare]ADO43884.1 lipoprotein yjbH [Ketogulonicigenium vulgare Y25]AEM42142.1 putative lipoprotein [Ketogulonicigenium vulgare WSH-001]ALJ79767.1 hypothetical protein KVH_00285 [Ketogulonicigenium vulgare]ANW32687.1 hypothetical protein KvSKV_00295 [Ketogulonicigenium vulgare]AOZ55918.1 lipoprotein yjbH [Ketogulonicigenium vulgare]